MISESGYILVSKNTEQKKMKLGLKMSLSNFGIVTIPLLFLVFSRTFSHTRFQGLRPREESVELW